MADADLLNDALAEVTSAIDAAFDSYLPRPEDGRARLYEAMRHASIGGGKRLRPLLVPGSAQNFKVTYPQDFALAEAIFWQRSHRPL